MENLAFRAPVAGTFSRRDLAMRRLNIVEAKKGSRAFLRCKSLKKRRPDGLFRVGFG
jgi:hypothetical protein